MPPTNRETHRIHLCEADTNARGDLFGRLMTDLLVALGYGSFRLNIHKAGREIDIQGEHRTELRGVVAECKAESRPIGGDQLNKFVGALDAERRKRPNTEVHGYYISLSGFTETAKEQESDVGDSRVSLLDSSDIVRELITGRIIAPLVEATERAGRVVAQSAHPLTFATPATLLACDSGWIWAFAYQNALGERVYVLIHADGEPVPDSVYQQLRRSACRRDCFVADSEVMVERQSIPSTGRDQVRHRYFEYLQQECGEIQLQGLPADQEVGAKRLALEALFVPLHLNLIDNEQVPLAARVAVGKVLQHHSRLAILANPGAGKSTLLKRLAVAYAFPGRRSEATDSLPDRNWYPLFIRCRQIPDPLAPIESILREIPSRAEFGEFREAFLHVLRESLQLGTALLLIDGLDEIADESHRVAFVEQLRTFLARYPAASIVVTSREAGFRIVGGRLADQCRHYRLADFDVDDIERLIVAWHVEVIGNRDDVRNEATALAHAICRLDRVRRLAENPLLLTTLLLVKRWVGQLPTKRVVLYNKAIEVLLMTWNVEAHRPLDPEEIVPQLAFVAHWMMENGVQQISQRGLYRLLLLARKQMPEVLGFARLSSAEVVKSVEFRSSLLVQAGHAVENGELVPVYEFRHLTFQEYLAARALVEGFYADRQDSDTLLGKLSPHLQDETWAEVILLAAVIAGRRCEPVIKALIQLVTATPPSSAQRRPRVTEILSRCLSDEVQVSPDTLDEAFVTVIRSGRSTIELSALLDSRYGERFKELVFTTHANSVDALLAVGSAVGYIMLRESAVSSRGDLNAAIINRARVLLTAADAVGKSRGCLMIMEAAFLVATQGTAQGDEVNKALRSVVAEVGSNLASNDPRLRFSATWASAWLGEAGLLDADYTLISGAAILKTMTAAMDRDLLYVATWAFVTLAAMDPKSFRASVPLTQEVLRFIARPASDSGATDMGGIYLLRARAMLSLYYGLPWSEEQAVGRMISIVGRGPRGADWVRERLRFFGDAGKAQLKRLPDQAGEASARDGGA